MRLFIDAQHDRIFRWAQVQADYIRCLWSEFGIRGNAPATSALELDLMSAQHSPNLIVTDIPQLLGE